MLFTLDYTVNCLSRWVRCRAASLGRAPGGRPICAQSLHYSTLHQRCRGLLLPSIIQSGRRAGAKGHRGRSSAASSAPRAARKDDPQRYLENLDLPQSLQDCPIRDLMVGLLSLSTGCKSVPAERALWGALFCAPLLTHSEQYFWTDKKQPDDHGSAVRTHGKLSLSSTLLLVL